MGAKLKKDKEGKEYYEHNLEDGMNGLVRKALLKKHVMTYEEIDKEGKVESFSCNVSEGISLTEMRDGELRLVEGVDQYKMRLFMLLQSEVRRKLQKELVDCLGRATAETLC